MFCNRVHTFYRFQEKRKTLSVRNFIKISSASLLKFSVSCRTFIRKRENVKFIQQVFEFYNLFSPQQLSRYSDQAASWADGGLILGRGNRTSISAVGFTQPAMHCTLGVLSRGQSGLGAKLTTNLRILLRIRMSGAVPILSLHAFIARRDNLAFTFYSLFRNSCGQLMCHHLEFHKHQMGLCCIYLLIYL